MINLNKGNSADKIIVTLIENKTIADSGYRFVFTNTSTNKPVQVDFLVSDDISEYPERTNQFIIDTSTVFADYQIGQYLYTVIEIESGVVLEKGKMLLTDVIKETKGYSPVTNYIGYGG